MASPPRCATPDYAKESHPPRHQRGCCTALHARPQWCFRRVTFLLRCLSFGAVRHRVFGQETGISMTGQLCHGLLVYAAVQQSGDEEVTQGVQMVFGVESISGVNLPQALGECIGMDERAVCVCKPAWSATSPCGAARTAGATLPRQAASARSTATAHRSTAKQAAGR